MKPTRGLSRSWFGSLPKERRMALASIAVLLMILGAMVFYQQFQTPEAPPREAPAPMEEPPSTAGGTAQPDTVAVTPVERPAPASAPPPAPPDRLSAPLAGRPEILKTYRSLDEAYGDFRLYTAIAYAARPGQSVMAAAKGTVAAIEADPADGTTVVLDHDGGMSTHYAGLGKVLVAQGTRVESGSIIGQTGDPGPARAELGPHLAFAVWLGNDPVDPSPYLQH